MYFGRMVVVDLLLLWVFLMFSELKAMGIHGLPERAKHGKLWKMIQQETMENEATTGHFRRQLTEHYFTQGLDHFDTKNRKTFQQRYIVDDTYWTDPSGPIFLYIGGESELPNTTSLGFVGELARIHQAKIVSLEHRFYGKSVPGNDLSVENLKYLRVEQALADLANFVVFYQEILSEDSNKWLAIGGSYAGALAAWFRIAYPKATVGALSSSGVVNAIYDFTAYDEQVAASVGPECANVLRQTTHDFELEIQRGKGIVVKQMLNANKLSDPDFFYMLADAAATAVQYGHKDKLCTPMIQAFKNSKSLLQAFAGFTNEYYGTSFGSSCFYDTQCVKSNSLRYMNDRAWRWQKCSQVAYFQVAPQVNSIRSSQVSLAYHNRQCKEIFGDWVNPQARSGELNQRFGGATPTGTNVFFSNGGDDPWQKASVLKSLGANEPAHVARCDLCGHCGDISTRKLNETPPLPLLKQQEAIKHYVALWLQAEHVLSLSSAVELSPLTLDKKVESTRHTTSSMLTLLPFLAIFVALKVILHIDEVRDIASSRWEIL